MVYIGVIEPAKSNLALIFELSLLFHCHFGSETSGAESSWLESKDPQKMITHWKKSNFAINKIQLSDFFSFMWAKNAYHSKLSVLV